ncbi:hypothetical protein ACFSTC_46750 [Nonomuraea ferruginea]
MARPVRPDRRRPRLALHPRQHRPAGRRAGARRGDGHRRPVPVGPRHRAAGRQARASLAARDARHAAPRGASRGRRGRLARPRAARRRGRRALLRPRTAAADRRPVHRRRAQRPAPHPVRARHRRLRRPGLLPGVDPRPGLGAARGARPDRADAWPQRVGDRAAADRRRRRPGGLPAGRRHARRPAPAALHLARDPGRHGARQPAARHHARAVRRGRPGGGGARAGQRGRAGACWASSATWRRSSPWASPAARSRCCCWSSTARSA